ncbi:MAG TPA: hypothetical protein K8W01_04925 [Methylorubrum populi]|uniref:Uncharacterized protein n=1 Tax=Methylorubrum populi TaxID=223967 RepID=A0A921E229_9HYPH|nr:hypothetical protein [Methylorubrum populi]
MSLTGGVFDGCRGIGATDAPILKTALGWIEDPIIMNTKSDRFEQTTGEHPERDAVVVSAHEETPEEAMLTEAEMDGVAGGFEFFPIPKIKVRRT